jgi:hypothetical protein
MVNNTAAFLRSIADAIDAGTHTVDACELQVDADGYALNVAYRRARNEQQSQARAAEQLIRWPLRLPMTSEQRRPNGLRRVYGSLGRLVMTFDDGSAFRCMVRLGFAMRPHSFTEAIK